MKIRSNKVMAGFAWISLVMFLICNVLIFVLGYNQYSDILKIIHAIFITLVVLYMLVLCIYITRKSIYIDDQKIVQNNVFSQITLYKRDIKSIILLKARYPLLVFIPQKTPDAVLDINCTTNINLLKSKGAGLIRIEVSYKVLDFLSQMGYEVTHDCDLFTRTIQKRKGFEIEP